jgi:hypothetical protein
LHFNCKKNGKTIDTCSVLHSSARSGTYKQIDKLTSDFNQQSAIFHKVFFHNMVHWELLDIPACTFAPVKEFIY